MSNQAVILGVVLFLLLHWVGPGKPARGRRTAALFVLALAVFPFLLALIFPVPKAWPGSRTALFSAFAQRKWQKTRDEAAPLVLLIEGASHTAFAVNGELLERELQKRAIAAHIIQISAGGANSFDRQSIFEQWIAAMSREEKERLAAGRFILIQEVHESYDLDPLSNFADIETMTSQGISAMHPKNAARARAAIKDRGANSAALEKRIGTHLLAHVFRLGILQMPDYWKRLSAPASYTPKEAGTDKEVIEKLAANLKKISKPDQLVLIPKWTEWRLAWILEDAFQGMVDEVWYHAPPSIDKSLWAYEESWAEQHSQQPFFRGEEIVEQLWKPKFWIDRGHVSKHGAEVYTLWLAEKIAAQLTGKSS